MPLTPRPGPCLLCPVTAGPRTASSAAPGLLQLGFHEPGHLPEGFWAGAMASLTPKTELPSRGDREERAQLLSPTFWELQGEDAHSSVAARRLRSVSEGSAQTRAASQPHHLPHLPPSPFHHTPFPRRSRFCPKFPPSRFLVAAGDGALPPRPDSALPESRPCAPAAAPSCSGNPPGFPRPRGTRGAGVTGEAVASSPTAQGRRGGGGLSIGPVLLEK